MICVVKVLYIDCFAGISGNSFLGAMIDAGFNENALREMLAEIPFNEYSITINREKIHGIAATQIDLRLSGKQPTKNLDDVLTLVNKSNLSKKVRDGAASILTCLSEAKARTQNIPPSAVRFSGKDALKHIIIATGLFTALDYFAIEKVITSPLAFSPASQQKDLSPVTLELLKGIPIETNSSFLKEALITDLGAAIIKAIALEHGSLPNMMIEQVGYGVEKSRGSFFQGLRLIIGTVARKRAVTDNMPPDKISVLETNIDDMNPEFYPYLIDRLLKAGALDAFLTPIIMKGGRPANTLTVMGRTKDSEKLADIIFQETTSLGIRMREEKRITAFRQTFAVMTGFGVVRIKTGFLNNQLIQVAPEYKDCCSLAAKKGVPVKEVYAAAQQAARALIVSRETSSLVAQNNAQDAP